jgi:DivIVA domain-containing protein
MTEDPRIDPADLRNVRFPGSSRRYDARAVDQFLETVAARIAATNDLVDTLRAEVAELGAVGPAPAAAVPPPLSQLDDDDLVRLVGEETASVLSTARRAADEIRSKAEESAARMIREATTESDVLVTEARSTADELTRHAEEVLARATGEATAEADRIREDAEAEAAATKAEASELAEAELAAAEQRRADADAEVDRILEEAREEGRGMVQEAKEVRARVLEDLQRRRDAARDQIERLLAGRERLLAAYGLVRENLDDITSQLADALPDPGEPELPDGFVGIVGPAAVDPHGNDEPAAGDAAPAAADEVDDTVVPVTETEADIVASTGQPADQDDDVDGPEAGAAPEPEPAAGDIQADAGTEADPATADDAAEDGAAGGDTPTELDADRAEDHAAGTGGDVDELFARLRAEREESVARARQVVAPASESEPEDEPEPAPEDEPEPAPEDEASASAEDTDTAHGDADTDADGDDEVAAAGTASSTGTGGDVDRVPAEFLADEETLTARAEALTPLEGALNRALKRRLADEQNELLDLLRRSGATTADTLLPEVSTQAGGYVAVAEEHLAAAARAGAEAAGRTVAVDVTDLASTLGAALVEPFRRRVERSAVEVDGDPDELDERLRALYREWKVQHIGPVAADALLSAYALGTLRAAEPAGRVRWLIDPGQGPCPDAQDNALAGAVPAGEAFATGDACPQAHPGCRCVLVTD